MTEEELIPFCECGCGLRVTKVGNRFINGHSRRGKRHTLETIAKMSAWQLGVPHTSEAQLAADEAESKRRRGVPIPPEVCAAISATTLGVLHTSPAQIAADNAKRGVPLSPEHIIATKKGREKSGANERQCGGNDIVEHHIAYDFLRPKALIVKITRKFHGQIHHPKGCSFSKRGYSLID